jgi:chromosome segregation ATPase
VNPDFAETLTDIDAGAGQDPCAEYRASGRELLDMEMCEIRAAMPGGLSSESAWEAGYRQGFRDAQVASGATDRTQLAAIEKLLQQVLAEKSELVARLQTLGEQLAVHDRAVSADLKKGIDDLQRRAACAELESAALRQDIAALEGQLTKRSKQYVEQSWQFNRSRVFMDATRKVLEALLQGGAVESKRVRELFVQKYTEQVQRAQLKGLVKAAPEASPEFAEAMPSTRNFILEMLKALPHR